MSIADVTEDAILNLVFSATAWANYADNAASAPQTQISVALHAADPGDAGTQATSEVSYVSYARVNVGRGAGWTTSSGGAGSVSPVANIDFPAGTGGGSPDVSVATFFSVGKTSISPDVGTTAILWSGSVSPSITTGNGITPRLTTASTITLA